MGVFYERGTPVAPEQRVTRVIDATLAPCPPSLSPCVSIGLDVSLFTPLPPLDPSASPCISLSISLHLTKVSLSLSARAHAHQHTHLLPHLSLTHNVISLSLSNVLSLCPSPFLYGGTSLIRKRTPLETYHGPVPRVLGGSEGVGVLLQLRHPYNSLCLPPSGGGEGGLYE